MTTFATGRKAEAAAAKYLQAQGYKILNQNWRTKACEIDLVAQKSKVIYFVEVKYRQSADQGGGLEYITGKKLQQMAFAAKIWVAENNYEGQHCLAAVEVSGEDYEVTGFIDNVF
ncbi:MAG: YraN family protein [Candidatus Saccharimonadales bacterium]